MGKNNCLDLEDNEHSVGDADTEKRRIRRYAVQFSSSRSWAWDQSAISPSLHPSIVVKVLLKINLQHGSWLGPCSATDTSQITFHKFLRQGLSNLENKLNDPDDLRPKDDTRPQGI